MKKLYIYIYIIKINFTVPKIKNDDTENTQIQYQDRYKTSHLILEHAIHAIILIGVYCMAEPLLLYLLSLRNRFVNLTIYFLWCIVSHDCKQYGAIIAYL